VIAHRDARDEDLAFVIPTWSRTYKMSRQSGMIASEDWASVMHPQIRKVVALPETRTVVAYESTDPTVLYGFIAGDPIVPLVHFVLVKEAFRRAGCARGLFAALGVDPARRFFYTCWTPACLHCADKIPLAQHEPKIARYARTEERWRP
jgi:hypothetical protein